MHETTAPFTAHIINCLMLGEDRLNCDDGSWVRGLIRLTLDGRYVELRQRPWVVRERSWSELRDHRRHTTDLYVPNVAESEREEVFRLADMLAALLSFMTASEVAVAGWTHPVTRSRSLTAMSSYRHGSMYRGPYGQLGAAGEDSNGCYSRCLLK